MSKADKRKAAKLAAEAELKRRRTALDNLPPCDGAIASCLPGTATQAPLGYWTSATVAAHAGVLGPRAGGAA